MKIEKRVTFKTVLKIEAPKTNNQNSKQPRKTSYKYLNVTMNTEKLLCHQF